MKYEITHSCGCEETVDIFGTNTHGERDRKIAWLESKPCRECEHKAKAEGMAELEGSEKQVAWAIDIRARMVASLSTFGGPSDSERVARVIDAIKTETSSKWFIDNRDLSVEQLYRAIASTLIEIVEGENGSCEVRHSVAEDRAVVFTSGGIVYWFHRDEEAVKVAHELVAKWDIGDFRAEDSLREYDYND